MNEPPTFYGIIPARYGSKRFQGKPLARILGKPMFWHVFDRARQCHELSKVLLATDDDRIASAAKERYPLGEREVRLGNQTGDRRLIKAYFAT